MFHYKYSKEQLERKSEELIRIHDPERMCKAKAFDESEILACCSGAELVYEYLSPNQSILGMTAFDDIEYHCWPYPTYPDDLREHLEAGCVTDDEQKYLPYAKHFPKGTILIERTLIEDKSKIGRYHFTLMHEIFHWILHQKCFLHVPDDFQHYSTEETFVGKHKLLVSDIDFIEWQANYCAASFLMPKLAVGFEYSKSVPDMQPLEENSFDAMWTIPLLAEKFSVSTLAMKYRLLELGLLKQQTETSL